MVARQAGRELAVPNEGRGSPQRHPTIGRPPSAVSPARNPNPKRRSRDSPVPDELVYIACDSCGKATLLSAVVRRWNMDLCEACSRGRPAARRP